MCASLFPTIALAEDLPPDTPVWWTCRTAYGKGKVTYVAPIVKSTLSKSQEVGAEWDRFLRSEYPPDSDGFFNHWCHTDTSESDAESQHSSDLEYDDSWKYAIVSVEWTSSSGLKGGPKNSKSIAKPETPNQPFQTKDQKGPTAAELATEKHRAVEERNRLAQEKYKAELAEQKRKVEEFERAKEEVARKMEEQRAAAQKAINTYEVKTQTRAEQLRQRELAAATSASGGRRFQATSAIVETREAAMAALLRQPLPAPLTDIQCAEVTMFSPPKWTCWGFYQGNRKATGASAQ